MAGLNSAERQSRATTAVSGVIASFAPLIDPARAVISVTSQGATLNGEAIRVAVTYTDNRFNVFPFMPALNGSAVVETIFLISDPSG